MTRRAYGWTLAGVVGLLVAPATAGAATYCVGAPGCAGTSEPDLQAGLNAASLTTTVADTVQVGNPGTPTPAGYFYSDGGNPANQVDIVGAGRAQTVLTGTGPGTATVLALTGPGSTVSHLTIRLPAGTWSGVQTSGTVHDVDLSTVDPGSGNQTGATFAGVAGGAPGWFGGTITLASGAGEQTGIRTLSAGVNETAQDLAITAQDTGVGANNGSLTLRRVSVRSGVSFIGAGEHVVVDNVAIRPFPGALSSLGLSAQASATNDAVLDVNHLSAEGPGTPGSYGILVTAAAAGRSATGTIRNSIVRDYRTNLYSAASAAGAGANVNVSFTDVDLVHTLSENSSGGTGTITAGAGMVDENPHWVDAPGGNFELSPTSLVIDAGDPAPDPGSSSTDVAGHPRIAHGRTDMGAIEFQPPIVSPPPPAPLPDTTAPTVTLRGLKSKLTLKQLLKGASVTITPDEPASLDVTLAGAATTATLARAFNLALAHKALPLAAGARKVTLRPSRKLVGTARKFKVRVVIVATDRAGNTRRITKRIAIKR
ncbi:MAG: hypothetical protein JWN32_3364 [Solirubrobacterales bacterium]|jgi:hypothetical protein|nr:hypothetical protein [Solirubrobacterales bacterium]